MLAANQEMQIGGRHGGVIIQIHDVGLAISAHHHGRLGHLRGDRGRGLVGFDPAEAFLLVDGLRVAAGRVGDGFARPDLRPGAAQGDAIQTKRLQRVQEQAATRVPRVPDRSQSGGPRERVVAQGGGVLRQNHHLLRRHAAAGVVLMRRQQVGKSQFRAAIFQEGIGGVVAGGAPETGIKTRAGIGPAALQHLGKAPMELDVPQSEAVEFFLNPILRQAGAKDRTSHHHGQAARLQFVAGLPVPLPNPHILLGRGARLFAGRGPAAAQGLTEAQPVGGDQRLAGLSTAVHIGFDQQRAHAITLVPIGAHPGQDQPVAVAGQVGATQARPEQKTRQTNDSMTVLLARLGIPANPAVPASLVEGGRTKTESPNHLGAGPNQVAQLRAH